MEFEGGKGSEECTIYPEEENTRVNTDINWEIRWRGGGGVDKRE